ncbi:MAG: hypothetical protein Ct9H300mP14_10850 [Gammaproteobacteria bacterium]|nr:MAG: hypothetical protein Ct9H300mP14_10850 [Gammaproteobacteria bacterium]
MALRREIHREPELGLDLPKTRAKVLDSLSGLGLEIYPNTGDNGGGGDTPRRLFWPQYFVTWRYGCSTDVRGHRGFPFASQTPGHMHSCGHDAHTSMLASAAHLLSQHKEDIRGNVLFMFQPGEEGYGGAKIMLDEGLIEAGGKPNSVFALHVAPELSL